MHQIILYYNFSKIEEINGFCLSHKQKCRELDLTGRVYIATEGINGTLAGPSEQIECYKKYLLSLPGLENTEFKKDEADFNPFAKLIVKTRPEIVSLKSPLDINPQQDGGKHISPREWRKMLESGEDFLLLDVRNDYETKIGHFKGAVLPDVKNFFDFPKWLKGAGLNKEKTILMYCTGGIRCEKFSAFMKKQGYRDIYQLSGGIINYARKEEGRHFTGKCFVFDDRMAILVNQEEREPISRCEISGAPCDTYLNCANPVCNKLFICSEDAAKNMEGCCSEECRRVSFRRPFNPENIYTPFRKWYHYFKTESRPQTAVLSAFAPACRQGRED